MMDYRPGGKQFLEAQKRFYTLRHDSINENIPIEAREEILNKIKTRQDKLSWKSPKTKKRTVKTK